MNSQTPDNQIQNARHSRFSWLGLGSMTCAIAAMTFAFINATDPKIALDAARIDAAAALARSGFNWAEVVIENRVASIRGEAPGEPERVMAYEVVSKALRPVLAEGNIISKVRSQLTLARRAPTTAELPVATAGGTDQRIAAMEPTAAPATSWTAPPVQFPNGTPTFSAQPAATLPIETASVDKSATPTPSVCKDEFAATLSSSAIVFARDSASIEKQSRSVLDKLAGIAKRCNRFHLAIEGHTDSIGSKSHNLTLSQRRAEAVRTALVNRGIRIDHISARGFGAAQPLEQGTSDAALAKNRRIEITVSERKSAAAHTPKTATSTAQTWTAQTSTAKASKN